MAPMIPSYDGLDDTRLEEVLRERAFHERADLWVGRVGSDGWRAAFRVHSPAVAGSAEFTDLEAASGPTRREALVELARIDDIGTIT
jgi:hypothetical protein